MFQLLLRHEAPSAPHPLCSSSSWASVALTVGAVDVRAADLIHQQHEDEAQHQRHADAGVQLLVAVLVLAAHFHLCFGLRRLDDAGLAVAVVATCSDTEMRQRRGG